MPLAGISHSGPLRVFIVAGETSGDALGAKLIRALRMKHPDIEFSGIGGEAMGAEGLDSLFPMADIAVMGIFPVLKRLPTLLNRISRTVAACLQAAPHVLVAIDSPDFTHRVAKRVRAHAPRIPIVDYVSPTVWAWRPGRAKAMQAYVDHVLALLPFEPAAHARLGGPLCSYVGHPLVERLHELRPQSPIEREAREQGMNVLLLPGSRLSEIGRLMAVFGETVQLIAKRWPNVHFQLPVVPHVAAAVRDAIADWPIKPDLIEGEAAKFAAFRSARAAIAASGTVTLELALSGIPMVTAYRVSYLEARLVETFIQVDTVILPSLIVGEKFLPELLQGDATATNIFAAVSPLIEGGAARAAQLEKFLLLDTRIQVPGGRPSEAAADIVLHYAQCGRVPLP